MITFEELVVRQAKTRGRNPQDLGSSLLVFDPGHTTGWAFFENNTLQEAGQIATHGSEEATKTILPLLQTYKPKRVIYEDYRIYSWRRDHHVGSELITSQVIGTIKTLITMMLNDTEIISQPPSVAKTFAKDNKLRAWGFYQHNKRHANDAIRHGIYWLVHGGKLKPKQTDSHSVG